MTATPPETEKLDYVVVTYDPSWHQIKAHGCGTFSSLSFLKLTPEEAAQRQARLRLREYLYSRKDHPDWWDKYYRFPS